MSCGLTQEKLADLLSVSKGTVGNYEIDAAYPRTEIMFRLCSILHCDANFIYQDVISFAANSYIVSSDVEILEKYHSLDSHGKRMIDLVLKEEAARMAAGSSSFSMAEQSEIARDRYGSALKSSSLEYPSDLKEAE